MQAGRLDKIILIQKRTDTQDEYGTPIPEWKTVHRLWARRLDPKGREGFGQQQKYAEVTDIFRTRYRSGITPDDHRLVFDGRNYDIEAPVEIGRREGLEIMATARAE